VGDLTCGAEEEEPKRRRLAAALEHALRADHIDLRGKHVTQMEEPSSTDALVMSYI